jgi:hypothetical protein
VNPGLVENAAVSAPYLPDNTGREPSAAELATARDPRLGIAYAVAVRSEGGGENSIHQVVLTYRLHRRAPDGRELPALQVEMRGRRLQGMIADGDVIQAPGPLPVSGAIQLERVTNLTTGSPVVLMTPRAATGCMLAFWIALTLVGVMIVLAIVVMALSAS